MEIKVEPKTNGQSNNKDIETDKKIGAGTGAGKKKETPEKTIEKQRIEDNIRLNYSVLYKVISTMELTGIMKSVHFERKSGEETHIYILNINDEIMKCRNHGTVPSDETAELMTILFHLPFQIMSGEERIYLGLELKDKPLWKDTHSLQEMLDQAFEIEEDSKLALGISAIASEFIDRADYKRENKEIDKKDRIEEAFFAVDKRNKDREPDTFDTINISSCCTKHLDAPLNKVVDQIIGNPTNINPLALLMNIYTGKAKFNINDAELLKYLQRKEKEFIKKFKWDQLEDGYSPIFIKSNIKVGAKERYFYVLVKITEGKIFTSKRTFRKVYTNSVPKVLTNKLMGGLDGLLNPVIKQDSARDNKSNFIYSLDSIIKGLAFSNYKPAARMKHTYKECMVFFEASDGESSIKTNADYINDIMTSNDDIDSPDYIGTENDEIPDEELIRLTQEIWDMETSNDDIDSPDFVYTEEPEKPKEKLIRLTQEIWDMETSEDDIDSPDFVYTGEPEDTDGVLPYPLIINRDSDLFNLVYYMKQLYSVAIMGQSTKKKGELVDIVDSSNLKGRDLAAEKAALKQKISQAKKGKPRAAKAATQATQATAATKTPNIQ